MGQTGQLTTRQRQQRPVISTACQLLDHVEPLPHCPLEDLAQSLVHLATFPPSRPRPGRSRTGNAHDTRVLLTRVLLTHATSTYKVFGPVLTRHAPD